MTNNILGVDPKKDHGRAETALIALYQINRIPAKQDPVAGRFRLTKE